jgi:hypothetical protein
MTIPASLQSENSHGGVPSPEGAHDDVLSGSTSNARTRDCGGDAAEKKSIKQVQGRDGIRLQYEMCTLAVLKNDRFHGSIPW